LQAALKPFKEINMTVTVKTLVSAKQVENAQTTQYTAVNCKTIIDKFTVTNTSAGNVTISVNLVASGGSAGATNLIVDSRSIAPDETYTFPELVGQVLEPGSFISTIASAATSLTIRVSGREIT
jgi:P pilus assembly chaperone PapD